MSSYPAPRFDRSPAPGRPSFLDWSWPRSRRPSSRALRTASRSPARRGSLPEVEWRLRRHGLPLHQRHSRWRRWPTWGHPAQDR